MLRVDELEIRYGRIAAVRGISLEVRAGEVVGLIGPNGAGKTSTLAAIAGLLKPAAGRIALEDKPIGGLGPERVIRTGVALVPERRRIFGTLSVADNLVLGTTIQRNRAQARADVEAQLERFPVLRKYFRTPAGRLSGGEQQQLAIARALLSRPRLLLLDEPSLGLAPLMIDLVFETLAELKAQGVTVLLVEQNAQRTVAFADRTYVLGVGRIVAQGTREDFASSSLSDLYLGSEDTVGNQ